MRSPALNAAVQVVGMAVFAAWIWPPLLRVVGLEAFASWMTASALHRVALTPVLLIVTVVANTTRRGPRVARQEDAWGSFAASIGGELTQSPQRFEGGIWRGGPTVRLDRQEASIRYEVARQGDVAWTQVRSRVENTGGLAFHMCGPQRAMHALESAVMPLTRAGAGMARADAGAPERRAMLDQLSMLSSGPTLPTGHADLDGLVWLRTDDPDGARRVLGASGVSSALRQLATAVPGWSWSLVPDGTSAAGVMEIRLPGRERDLEHLHAAHALISVATGWFASQAGHDRDPGTGDGRRAASA